MKFTVEVEDFYLDEEDINEGLQKVIKNDVVQQIQKSIKEKVETQITMVVKEQVEKSLYTFINKTIADCIATNTIKVNNKEILIQEHIKNVFENNHGWNNPTDTIQKLSKKLGDEMKVRYDLMFATQIVAKMQEMGVLNEEGAKLLITDTPK